jgi:long-subunit fatty acid transport protein
MRNSRVAILAVLVAVAAVDTLGPGAARAGGILVGEAGSQAQERGGAFVAKADDPTALAINPAGLIKAEGVAVYVGVNLLHYNLTYQRVVTQPIEGEPTRFPAAENGAHWQPIPEIAVVERITDRLAFAQGLYAPQAFPNRDFPCLTVTDCTVDAAGTAAPQRYDIVHQESIIAFPSLALAYRLLPQLDLGARASWGFATVKARNFTWATINHGEDPGYDGDFQASATDSMVLSFGFGALYRPTNFLEIGAAFSTGGKVRSKGNGTATLGSKVQFVNLHPIIEPVTPDAAAACERGGTVPELKTCIDFDLPRKAQLGVRYVFRDGHGREQGDVELDGRWEGHNADSDVLVTVDGQDSVLKKQLQPVLIQHGFRSVWSGRLGGAYRFAVGAEQGLTVRGGLAFDTAAAPDAWTRADIDGKARQTFAVGLAYDLPGWQVDVGIALVHEGQVTVTRVDNPSPTPDNRAQPDPPQPLFDRNQQEYHPINEGTYDSGYVIGSFGLTARF